ncbi:hypothetical protein G8759_31310 [Spirosoma aureum]|uniref:Uncharacterized protein n=1 Tax=Spirosoma aureum TaxID=2692134 RepID=A0A6G9AX86_9BACT|nr:hypothetical protein [Spirosoma aureum]QIP16813.1 hypothetical protein G8759_31310 [Spirosoma aureum]
MSPKPSKGSLPDRYDFDELLQDDLAAGLQLAGVDRSVVGLADDVQVVHRHYNKPQMRSMLVGASEEYAVWGRGTGKSEGLIAPRTFRNVEVMPRGHGCFVGATYLQLLERTLPPVIKGWEAMGMVRGRDFWVREKPPKKLNIPQPIVGPITTEHCIFFRNGAVASMVSQDRPGSSNGKTVHWIAGDEAKFLNKPKLDSELLLTNRGDDRYFGGKPEFHSLLFCTDMPTSKSAMWILEQDKRMEPERIAAILTIRYQIYALYEQLLAYPAKRKAIQNAIAKLQAQWDELRKNAVYFSEASTLDNIHGFGFKALADVKARLPRFIFETAVLNRRPFLTEAAFYPDLDEHHFYDSLDYSYIDKFNNDDFGKGKFNDCRKDNDLDKSLPLDVALDYGASINTLLTGQPRGRQYRILKELYVTHPDRLEDLAKAFCAYYRHYPTKEVNYFYDHTATGTSAISNKSPRDIFADYLEKEGWVVNLEYLGHTDDPEKRYELWGRCLRGGDVDNYDVRFNRQNTEYVRVSMQQAQIAQGATGFKKDKADEKNKEIDQRQTTHFSDCADTLLVGAHDKHKSQALMSFDAIF